MAFLRDAATVPEAAQAALGGLTHPRHWLALDSAVRSEWWVEGWTSVLRSETPLALALSACDRDGRNRERATTLLTRDDLLPVLAIRATDWVAPVRDTALRLLAELLADPAPHRFQVLLTMAAAMRDRSRAAELISLVGAALHRFPDRLLEPALSCRDRNARRHTVQIAVEAGLLPTERLLRAAVEDPDQIVAVRCAEAAAALTEDAAALLPLLRSPVPTIRALALTRPALDGDAALCAPRLDDRARVVRETAHLGLRRAGLDPAEHYRVALRVQATPARIAGLAETGTREDAPFAQAALEDPRPAVRAEAVRTLHTLGADDPDTLVAMLHDPSGRVLRQVRRALRDHPVPEEKLWPLIAAGLPPATRRAGQRLLLDQGPWIRLRADLLLIEDVDPAIRTVAATDVQAWLQTQQYLPPVPQDMAGLVDDAAGALNERTLKGLRFILGLRSPAPQSQPGTPRHWFLKWRRK
ncbi:hypothetical protein ACRB68_77530 [Actinomadura sp. RB68]|uniref:Uncharacterized protein n=2 Tax=Actinomadura macrotermitis TaxID=2585200 RepID=A0A7K0CA51_9ACTN|nr:hypothetical protein [Actinomadura macrotermitis]